MTDKELLTLAAKAAGIVFLWEANRNNKGLIEEIPTKQTYNRKILQWVSTLWNPLIDNDKALSLAVKLGMSIELRNSQQEVFVILDGFIMVDEPYGDDPYAATRRAIVRAASEIGRGME